MEIKMMMMMMMMVAASVPEIMDKIYNSNRKIKLKWK
jgi:hypothetical protein